MRNKPKIGLLGLGGESIFLTVDHFHSGGETLAATSLYSEPGGKGYNQAVAAARLGADCLFLGAFGRDANGRLCEDFLKNEGITPLLQYTDTPTATAAILTDKTGETRVTVYRGAADCLTPDFVTEQRTALQSCSALLLGLECPLEATLAAAEIGWEQDIPVFLNPAPAQPLPLSLLKRFYLITPNRAEACQLLGLPLETPLPDLARAFFDAGFTRAVVTLGGDGALLIEEGKALQFGALPTRPKDTTGAGDTFNAALVLAVCEGQALTQAVELAMNAAAISVAHAHVMPGLPTRAEVEQAFLPCSVTPVFEI